MGLRCAEKIDLGLESDGLLSVYRASQCFMIHRGVVEKRCTGGGLSPPTGKG